MKNLLMLLTLFIMQANASITTNIVHMESTEGNTEVFVTYKGRVFEVDADRHDLLNKLETAKNEGFNVELTVEEGERFKSDKEVEKILTVRLLEKSKKLTANVSLTPMTGYTQSNIAGLDLATTIFSSLNVKTQRSSQCFNRAHIWAKEMFDNFKVDSMKIFIFYTKRFRREVSNKWWFHVAPMVDINGQFHVMDREFTRKPVTDKKWESIFTGRIGSNTNYRCKKIDNMNVFYDKLNTEKEYCNIIHTSMYYRSPYDMKNLADEGIQQVKWHKWEIKAAAKEAFKSWRKVYKENTENM